MKINYKKIGLLATIICLMLNSVACENEMEDEKSEKQDVAVEEESDIQTIEEPVSEPIPVKYADGLISEADFEEAMQGVSENTFLFSESTLDNNSFELYHVKWGTSSVWTGIVLWRYEDYLIYGIERFNCGESNSKATLLSKEQGDKFVEIIKNTEIKPLEDIGDEKDLKDGGYFREGYWYSDGEACQIEPLDLEELKLEMIEEPVMDIVLM